MERHYINVSWRGHITLDADSWFFTRSEPYGIVSWLKLLLSEILEWSGKCLCKAPTPWHVGIMPCLVNELVEWQTKANACDAHRQSWAMWWHLLWVSCSEVVPSLHVCFCFRVPKCFFFPKCVSRSSFRMFLQLAANFICFLRLCAQTCGSSKWCVQWPRSLQTHTNGPTVGKIKEIGFIHQANDWIIYWLFSIKLSPELDSQIKAARTRVLLEYITNLALCLHVKLWSDWLTDAYMRKSNKRNI